MARQTSTVTVVISRRHNEPGRIYWTVRHVWWGGPAVGSRDRVVASGTADVPIGERTIPQVTADVLRQALDQLVGA